MLCDIEVQDTPTVVPDDEKAKERAEGDRRNSEEVHRGNRFTVITEKGKPAPGRLRISRRPFHPTRDRSLRDIKAEHEKLAMDAWRSPRGVLNDHSEDQFLNLLRRLSSPDRPPDLGDQLPVGPGFGLQLDYEFLHRAKTRTNSCVPNNILGTALPCCSRP